MIRYDYGDPTLGTCKETVEGGNHFRYWVQSGSQADRYFFWLPSSASLENAHVSFFRKAGLFSWPFHMNFQYNVRHTSSPLPLISYADASVHKVDHDIIFNGCALSLSAFLFPYDAKSEANFAKI